MRQGCKGYQETASFAIAPNPHQNSKINTTRASLTMEALAQQSRNPEDRALPSDQRHESW